MIAAAQTPSTNPYVGVGLYTIPEAARLIGVQPLRLRRWALGYTFRTTENKKAPSPPLVQRDLPQADRLTILSFAELIEFMVIRLFREHQIPMREIRRASERAAELFGTKHPFADKRFQTEGRRIFADGVSPRGGACEELTRAQLVFDEAARPFFLRLDYQAD